MKTVIISIKPEYVEKIFSGEKKWEFRKSRITADKFFIYETAPISRIVGEFTPRWIGEGTPEAIYAETCNDGAGIDYDKFFEYFKGHKTAFAYEITNLKNMSLLFRLLTMVSNAHRRVFVICKRMVKHERP